MEPKSKKPLTPPSPLTGERVRVRGEEIVFWFFFAFGLLTVLLALGGGGYALSREKGFGAGAVGYLLIFLGLSLAGMLGSLIFIRSREKKKQ